ncbi:MAG: 4-diphosphocytidyl-2-C-methyl-D-erythritol kinase [Oceanicoccus sp.]|jgi:4-diphosphocytidyl-2-C-methyl-D-erythritol kinase
MNEKNSLTLLAPAKLNLMLHITGRRADGYHQLQTIFQLLDSGDTLHFNVRNDAKVTLIPALKGVANQDNLIVRAAQLLQSKTNQVVGVDIQLEKKLPMGGGLGGGSSNAATTLLALNQLWKLDFSIDQLATLGLELGADVPVFVRGESAWAEGIGEQLHPLNLPDKFYCVIKPPCEVSTEEIFSHKQLTRDSSPITIAAVFEQGDRNDCEAIVRELYPEVGIALEWLNNVITDFGQDTKKNVKPARLTGTGACIFAEFSDHKSAQHVLDKLPSELQGFVAQGVNISPVHKQLKLQT